MANKAVLFDLDGTLLDTSADLNRALNDIRQQQGLAPLPLSETLMTTGDGAEGLLAVGNDIDRNDPGFKQLAEDFFEHYQNNIYQDTQFFDGIEDVLKHLEQEKMTWGIVTNRSESLAHGILKHFTFPYAPSCIVGCDTVGKAKPHPEPVLHACQLIGYEPQQCLFIGDNIKDMQSGNSAGTVTIAALYGFIKPTENVDTWQATHRIEHPREVLNFL